MGQVNFFSNLVTMRALNMRKAGQDVPFSPSLPAVFVAHTAVGAWSMMVCHVVHDLLLNKLKVLGKSLAIETIIPKIRN